MSATNSITNTIHDVITKPTTGVVVSGTAALLSWTNLPIIIAILTGLVGLVITLYSAKHTRNLIKQDEQQKEINESRLTQLELEKSQAKMLNDAQLRQLQLEIEIKEQQLAALKK